MAACTQNGVPPKIVSCGPVPAGRVVQLNAGVAISANDIWAVGQFQNMGPGIPFGEHWDGHMWTSSVVPVGNWHQSAHLSAVSAASSRDVWAVGGGQNSSEQQTLIEHWNGSTWAVVQSPDASLRSNQLTAVDVIDANDAWTVGDYLTADRDLVLTEHWDGVSWTIVGAKNPAATINRLSGVSAVSANDVWAVGFRRESDNATPQTLIEHWDGYQWNVVSSPSPGVTASLAAVQAISAIDIWAAGSYSNGTTFMPLVEHWDGRSWSVASGPAAPNATVRTIAVTSSDNVWIAGGIGGDQTAGWLVLHWNGHRWSDLSPMGTDMGIANQVVAEGDAIWALGTYRPGACGTDLALIQRWDGMRWKYVPSLHDKPNV